MQKEEFYNLNFIDGQFDILNLNKDELDLLLFVCKKLGIKYSASVVLDSNFCDSCVISFVDNNECK